MDCLLGVCGKLSCERDGWTADCWERLVGVVMMPGSCRGASCMECLLVDIHKVPDWDDAYLPDRNS